MTISKLVNDIVLNAYYLIGEFSPQQPAPAYAIDNGIYLLNSLLGTFMAEGNFIPYYTEIEFPLVIGQDIYTIKDDGTGDIQSNKIQQLNFVTLEDTFLSNPTSYPVEIMGFEKLLDIQYSTDIQARPTKIILQNTPEYSTLQFFYVPDRAYTCKIKCKQQLDEAQYQGVLSQLPVEYQRFLRYALARELVSVYQTKNWTPILENEYQRMYKNLKANSDFDLTAHPEPLLTTASGYITTDIFVRT